MLDSNSPARNPVPAYPENSSTRRPAPLLLTCDSHGGTQSKGTRRRFLVGFATAVLIFGAVGFFQFWQRVDQSNLAGYADESAHFVTGICVLDYCKTAFGRNPVAFAENYYAHYPKVAFGHWPPLFYGVEAVWYGVLGATTLNAFILMGCITATASLILFLRLRKLYGTWIALLAISAFLWLPVVRTSTLLLMSDMLAALFMLLAVLAFSDGLILGAPRSWFWFTIWTVAAIMTKESAVSLLVFAPVALLLLAGKSLLVPRTLFRIAIGFGLVVAVTLLLYAATGVLRSRDLPQLGVTLADLWPRLLLAVPFFKVASVAMFLVAGYGVFEALVRRRVGAPIQLIHTRIALLWLVITVASQMAARTAVDVRYFLGAYFALTFLFAQGLHSIHCATDRVFGVRAAGFLAAVCALVSVAAMPNHKLYDRRTGYAEIAESIPFDSRQPVILVSSDEQGEGAFIAERLIRDSYRDGVVLRASKMLSNSDLLGNRKQLIDSGQQVLDFLNSVSARFVVLDMNGFVASVSRKHHRLLEDTIRGKPEQFRLLGDFPLDFDGLRREGAVQVYENLKAGPNAGGPIRIDMTNSLGKVLEIHQKGGNRISAIPFHSSPLPAWLLRFRPPEPNSLRSIQIDPLDDRIDPAGDWGRIYVSAPPGRFWHTRHLPHWMTLTSRGSGNGSGIIEYRLDKNASGKDRLADIPIGDSLFRLVQPHFPYVYFPFVETFINRNTRAPSGGYSYLPQPSRWHLEDSPGGNTRLSIVPGGPDGHDSLMVDRSDPPDADPRATAIYFPGIDLQEGAGYRLTLWLKTEYPSEVSIQFGQATAPGQSCGLDRPVDATTDWRKVAMWFRATGQGCKGASQRLSIELGKIAGKLWLSQVVLSRETPEEALDRGVSENRHRERQSLNQISPGESPGLLQQTVKPLQARPLHP